MAPSSTKKGVNFNTISCQTPGLPCPCSITNNCANRNWNIIFAAKTFSFANGKVFPSLGNSNTNPFIRR